MKKLVNIVFFLFIIVFYYLTKSENVLSLTISFSLFLLLSSIFSGVSIKNALVKQDKDNVLKYSILSVSIFGGVLSIISYFIGKMININNLEIINLCTSVFVIMLTLIKILGEYLEIIKYKKLGINLVDYYKIAVLIINTILSIFLFKVFKLDFNTNIIILYLIGILIAIILFIMFYIKIYKKRIKNKIDIKIIKNILIGNSNVTLFNITKSAYIYTSVIILYYVLINKYNYSYNEVGNLISSVFLYGLVVIYFIYIIIDKYLKKKYEVLKENINKDSINLFISKLLRSSLKVSILFMVISGPLCYIIFNNSNNIIFNLIPLLLFYIIYNYVINIVIISSKSKYIYLFYIIGIMIKIIFEIPLIATVYRMGYSLSFGSVLSSIIGLLFSIIISYILINNKYKLNSLNNFNEILNIVYENIIYCLVLVLCTLIVDVNTKGFLSSLLVVIFYLVITIIFYITKNYIKKKKV